MKIALTDGVMVLQDLWIICHLQQPMPGLQEGVLYTKLVYIVFCIIKAQHSPD